MVKKEGDQPESLNDIVQERIRAEDERKHAAALEARQKTLDELEQSLRLEDAPEAVRELLGRFSVRDLLEEVKSKFWSGSQLKPIRPEKEGNIYYGYSLGNKGVRYSQVMKPYGKPRPTGRYESHDGIREIEVHTVRSTTEEHLFDLYCAYFNNLDFDAASASSVRCKGDDPIDTIKEFIAGQMVREIRERRPK